MTSRIDTMEVVVGHSIRDQIAFVGPFGVGKTTALRAVSDVPVANMDVSSVEAALAGLDAHGKNTTTIGFDYGELHLPDGNVALYGVPGQERFDAIWDNVLSRSSGVILWLHGDRPDAAIDAQHWLSILKDRGAVSRLAVVVTRIAPSDEARLVPVRDAVRAFHPFAPVMTGDPRERMHVVQAIVMALSSPKPE